MHAQPLPLESVLDEPARSEPASADPAADERRATRRVHLQTAVGLYSETNFYTGFSNDISEGGIFVQSYLLEPVGTEVEIELALPGGCELRADGVVRWVRDPRDPSEGAKPGMGIQFTALDDRARALIAEFVMNREPDFHDV